VVRKLDERLSVLISKARRLARTTGATEVTVRRLSYSYVDPNCLEADGKGIHDAEFLQ
jgi:hypothetical protein